MSDVAASLLDRLAGLSPDEQWTLLRALEETPPGSEEGEAAAETALVLLEGLTPAHGTLVGMCCMNILVRHGTPAHIPRLRAASERLPAMPGLRDWRQDAAFALDVLACRARGDCICGAYAAHARPAVAERFETLSETQGDWELTTRVRCRACGTERTVHEIHSYHYPISRWG